MPETGERLVVQLEARVADFERRMKKAERTGTRSYKTLSMGSRSATRRMEADMLRSTSNINRALATSTVKIGAFSKAMVSGLAVGAVSVGLSTLTTNLSSTVKGIAAVGDEAKRAGLALGVFQEWAFVAEQNRIAVDSLIDGFKELNLRADEFIVTGKGPAADAFKRLGLSSKQLERALEDPSELMLDIIRRLEDFDRAARIRIADEIFGGTAGERFVELVDRGERSLRATIATAHDVGAVLDEEMIAKADELDRKFAQLQTRIGTLGKKLAVALSEGLSGILSAKKDLEGLFGDLERAEAVLGKDLAEGLDASRDAVRDHADELRRLHGTYDELFNLINRMTGPDGVRVFEIDDTDARFALAGILGDLKTLVDQLENGQIEASEFEEEIGTLVGEAQDVAKELAEIDSVEFANVISAIEGIGDALRRAVGDAQSLKSELTSSVLEDFDPAGPPRRGGKRRRSDLAPETSPRPRTAPALIGEPSLPGSTGGGGRSEDYFAREVVRIQERTNALNAEAAALVAVARSGQQYGDMIEYARTKAELLNAAQREGKEITPELRAEIDELARAYAEAGNEADTAADHLGKIEREAQRGAEALTDVFFSVLEGSKSAKEAVADLLMEIAKVQFQSALLGLNAEFGGSGGGPLGFLGGLLSLDGGGYTGNGPRSGGLDGRGGFLAMMHPQETVIDHTKGNAQAPSPSVSIEIDARGAQVGAAEQIEQTVRAMLPEITRASVAAVGQARRRGMAV